MLTNPSDARPGAAYRKYSLEFNRWSAVRPSKSGGKEHKHAILEYGPSKTGIKEL